MAGSNAEARDDPFRDHHKRQNATKRTSTLPFEKATVRKASPANPAGTTCLNIAARAIILLLFLCRERKTRVDIAFHMHLSTLSSPGFLAVSIVDDTKQI